ncbi:MAG: bifunctional folylpolyglutamate synthase/dihydrofolate synthase [Candidatus Eremiobacteraeota bacterium]|nr:bifunctional folylpolyglutamate synthase/dihydrofolate synthase [Candidatus Eremiobacteraeota bacterium]
MNYEQTEAYLLGTVNETVSRRGPHRLDRMRALLSELGDPHLKYPTIHVGGTSGKGSTSTMIASVLLAGGNRCGLHTKPHLVAMTERARIDGVPISKELFAELLSEMMPALENVTHEHSRPSYYETLLALAFVAFARAEVDVAVIEVGIGGTLDGTNVIAPMVSVLTNVGLDHVDVLGDTVEAIAADKVGIAKPGVPFVSAVEQPSVRRIVEEGCARAGAPFVGVFDEATIERRAQGRFGQALVVQTPRAKYEFEMPVLGKFQAVNAATAIVALEQLPEQFRPSAETVRAGFEQLALPGRMEVFPSHPTVVFDVAHNPDKARSLAEALTEQFPDRHFTFVIAISASKEAADIIRELTGLSAAFIFTSFSAIGRTSSKPQRLASIAEDLGAWGRAVASPVDAFMIARRNASPDDVIVVTGSTFVVGQLREWWFENVRSEASAR